MTPAVARIVSVAFGFAMAAAAALEAHGPALAVVIGAVVAVSLGLRVRVAATAAVLLAAAALVTSNASPAAAAMSGVSAAAYLVLRHTASGVRPAMAAAVGFAFAGLWATSLAPQVPWLPLLAPVAVIGIYTVAVRPFVHNWTHSPLLMLDGWRS